MQSGRKDIISKWQVVVQTSENSNIFQWDLDLRKQRKIGRIFHRLKENGEIGTIIPQTDKYLNCVIMDTFGNQLHCGNGQAICKKGNIIEFKQDQGRFLENEILKTMPQYLEQEILTIINYIENTT